MRFLISLVFVGVLAGQTAEKMLEAARHREVMAGDLKGAIAEYRKIAAKFAGRPEVAAQALVKMGQCQEKLGESEARRSYERVVKEYAGAGSYAAEARARLAAMGGAAGGDGARARVVWDGAPDYWGKVSNDGRYLSYVDWTTGDLAIRDLVKGESRRVTNYGGYKKAGGEVESTLLSPDGRRVVFNWGAWGEKARKEGEYELRLIQADGTGQRTLRKAGPGKYFEPYGWSSDGKQVAICEVLEERAFGQILLVDVDSGKANPVATKSRTWKGGVTFSPDGKWLAYHEMTPPAGGMLNSFVAAVDGSGETMIADGASIIGWTPDGKGVVLRRAALEAEGARRGSGEFDQLFVQAVEKGSPQGDKRPLHLPSLGNVMPLGVSPSGALYLGTKNWSTEGQLRRLDLSGGMTGDPISKWMVAGFGMSGNHGNLRFSPDGNQLASVRSADTIRLLSEGGRSERTLATTVRELRRFEWTPDGTALLAAALGRDSKIGMYRIDLAGGDSKKLCELPRVLIFVPSGDGKSVYYLDRKGIYLLDLTTCRERVVLERKAEFPGGMNLRRSRDGRSLLLISFAEASVFDLEGGTVRSMVKRDGEVGLTVSGADWSADGKEIYLLTQPDETKDELREVWIVSAEGGAPRKLPSTVANRDFAVSPDGKYWAVVKEQSHGQVWAVENFLPAK